MGRRNAYRYLVRKSLLGKLREGYEIDSVSSGYGLWQNFVVIMMNFQIL
jgi:hypothetical protein